MSIKQHVNLKNEYQLNLPLNIGIVFQIPWINIVAWMCTNWKSAGWSCHICTIWEWICRWPIDRTFISCQRFNSWWTRLIAHFSYSVNTSMPKKHVNTSMPIRNLKWRFSTNKIRLILLNFEVVCNFSCQKLAHF